MKEKHPAKGTREEKKERIKVQTSNHTPKCKTHNGGEP
jgi:hypothetical protein